MSRVDLSSAGFSKVLLPNGMLQTNSALNTTLQTVKDNVGNSSTLLLSTVDAQFNSTLRIHTDSSELLDIEDTGANNRFNINRVVQKINLDFSSKPTDTTTVVGAIRTATNGSNLADVFTFLENGTVGLNNPAPSSTYKLDIVGNVNASSYIVTGGTSSQFLKADGSLDSTSYTPQSRTITINGLTQDLTANRTWTIATPTLDSVTTAGNTTTNSIAIGTASAPTAKINIKGAGSTSATTSLNIVNSVNTVLMNIADNGAISLNNNTINTNNSGNVSANYFTAGLDLNWGRNGVGNNLLIGSGSINASARLQVDSTTLGFLPPRMTSAQRTAIASPAVGLMVYQTDATEGVYVYKSTGWAMLL